MEAMGTAFTTIAQPSAAGAQGSLSDHDMGENLQRLGGHDMGRFSRALYEQVFPIIGYVCQGL